MLLPYMICKSKNFQLYIIILSSRNEWSSRNTIFVDRGRYSVFCYPILYKGADNMDSKIHLLSYLKSIKNGTDDYVRDQLYAFNFGKFDDCSFDTRRRIANVIGQEMDIRSLW